MRERKESLPKRHLSPQQAFHCKRLRYHGCRNNLFSLTSSHERLNRKKQTMNYLWFVKPFTPPLISWPCKSPCMAGCIDLLPKESLIKLSWGWLIRLRSNVMRVLFCVFIHPTVWASNGSATNCLTQTFSHDFRAFIPKVGILLSGSYAWASLGMLHTPLVCGGLPKRSP